MLILPKATQRQSGSALTMSTRQEMLGTLWDAIELQAMRIVILICTIYIQFTSYI